VNLRDENASNAPHRSIFRENIIENNGDYGILIESPATDILIENNTIRDTDKGTQKVGVYISEKALPAKLDENKMSGHKDGDVINKAK
jgi:parallel beta-helix repeat protein